MWRVALGALFIVSSLGGVTRVKAQPPTPALPPARASLVLVIESSDGVSGANQLRAQLSRQFNVKVLALGEVDPNAAPPGAMIAIATERTNAVRVVYVDAQGRRDTLRAPAPARREDMPSVVQALAGALLQRHLRELTQPYRGDAPNHLDRMWLDEESRLSLSAFSRSLHAALSRMGPARHRSGDLHREDF